MLKCCCRCSPGVGLRVSSLQRDSAAEELRALQAAQLEHDAEMNALRVCECLCR